MASLKEFPQVEQTDAASPTLLLFGQILHQSTGKTQGFFMNYETIESVKTGALYRGNVIMDGSIASSLRWRS